MTIGIITFHAAFNYGSMLQAWALQTYLERQGHCVEIVNFRPKSQKKGYHKPISFASIHTSYNSLRRLLLAPDTIPSLSKKWHLFDVFMHKYLNLTKEYTCIEDLRNAKFNYDVLITGSDQIWNTQTFDFSEAYFGTFVNSHTIKIAYAPSMGPNPEKQDIAYIKKLLNGFSSVAVREERTKNFIVNNGIFDNVDVVLDPTMLLEKKDYDILIDEAPLYDGDYVFYYTPGGVRHEFIGEASLIGNQLGLPVVCESVYMPGDLKSYSNVIPFAAVGPCEFLNLVKNAKVVCGASFHLMVFSILFDKDFYCMNGDIDSRMNNLMKTCGTEDRIWSIVNKGNNALREEKYDLSTYFAEIKSKSQQYLNLQKIEI